MSAAEGDEVSSATASISKFQPLYWIFSSLETTSKGDKSELFLASNTSRETCEDRGYLRSSTSSSLNEVHKKHLLRSFDTQHFYHSGW